MTIFFISDCFPGAVAAYNFGVGNVQSWGGLDIGSTGNDYSNDVMARAQYLHNHYGWSQTEFQTSNLQITMKYN